jgi:hypothetical protein
MGVRDVVCERETEDRRPDWTEEKRVNSCFSGRVSSPVAGADGLITQRSLVQIHPRNHQHEDSLLVLSGARRLLTVGLTRSICAGCALTTSVTGTSRRSIRPGGAVAVRKTQVPHRRLLPAGEGAPVMC